MKRTSTTTHSPFKRQVVDEIHRQNRINFKRRRVIIKSLLDLFQIDLVEMIPYAKENKGYKYLLGVINCFSKFAWAFPLKTKTGPEVCNAMKNVFREQVPKNIQSDMGKEFFNKDFKELMTKYKINHYHTFSDKKSSIIERWNRTFKNMMFHQFSLQGHYKWIDILNQLVDNYNNKKHRTIGMKPKDVKKRHEKMLLDTVYNNIKLVDFSKQKFKLGDHVRISKSRGVFDKMYRPNWSTEIFTIRKVQLTNPITYLLQDENNEPISGSFYNEQVSRVKYPDIFLVEKVLKKKHDSYYVKWLGFPATSNSWVKISDVT